MSGLLSTRRFLPLFVTQFLGAFNDNLFKNAMIILITFKIAATNDGHGAMLVNLAYGLFILPLFLFSPVAGQLADRMDRARIARAVKLVEIALGLTGALGLYVQNLPLLMATLFGFGAHSAFFGPVKYAILPQHLRDDELLAGNAYVDASTFLAILLGTIAGGKLVLLDAGVTIISLAMIGSALFGYLTSRHIPEALPPVSDVRLSWNLWRGGRDLIQTARKNHDVFLCILGISWFWFIGALFLAQIPSFAKDVLHADENVVVLFLTMFAIGIAVGSLLCSKIMHGQINAKPVPLAALGMTVFALRLYATSGQASAAADGSLMGAWGFLTESENWRVLFDFFALAVCGGFYSVPLYTMMQHRTDSAHGARAIACNNLLNALFMVVAAVMAMGMIKAGLTIPQIFGIVAILNAGAALYICKLLPFSLIGLLLRLFYRVEVKGEEHFKAAGERVVIVANHTSYLDAALIAAFLPERPTFAINTFVAQKKWLKPLLSMVNPFTLDPTNPMAAKALIERVRQNDKVMIFPEGRITVTGSLMKIYEGPGMIADKAHAMILPIRIEGAQYSPFSYLKGKVRIRLFPKIRLTILPPRQFNLPEDVKGRERRHMAGAQLYDLMSGMMFDSSPTQTTLLQALIDARRIHGGGHVIVEDPQRKPLTYNGFLSRSFALARLLARQTEKDEDRLGILLPNATACAVAFFAVQAMGRATAMMNFTAGPSQSDSACRAAQLKTILTSRRFVEVAKLAPIVEAIQATGAKVLYLEDAATALRVSDKMVGLVAKFAPEWVKPKASPQDTAVILFTSGSEGTPKGVALSHVNILANKYQLASRVDFGPQDVIFNCLPMFHAFGLTSGTLLPLTSGIRTFFYPSPLHYRIVPEMIYDTNATILFGTDTFLSGYARLGHPYDCHSLRYVFAGAEKVKEETKRVWSEKFGLRILEGYGATETAPVISVNTPMHFRAGTVGRLLPGMEAKFESVPGIDNGQKLWVKGPNIMQGYFKEDQPGQLQPLADGWYDTGDIVACDNEGYIVIRGRTKRFAKIGGEMVSLTSVETAIAQQWPSHAHAVVSVPDDRKGEALVLLTDCATADTDALRLALRAHGLSELALPRRIIKMEKLPLLGTGKTDYVKAREIALAKQVEKEGCEA